MAAFDAFFSDLTNDEIVTVPDRAAPKPLPEITRCRGCNNTGLNSAKRYCVCAYGQARRKASHARKITANVNAAQRYVDFEQKRPDLMEFLVKAAGWSEFAHKMLQQVRTVKGLSKAQINSVLKMKSTCEAKAAEKANRISAQQDAAPKVDMQPILSMFEAAKASGLKRPAFRAEGLTLSLAPITGRNAGAIYVKDSLGEYMGKIMGDKFQAVWGAERATQAVLRIAADPKGTAIAYGRETGKCACCGRELTDPESIAAGIGPICQNKWAL